MDTTIPHDVLEYAYRDARAALRHASDDQRWADVAKYAAQLQTLREALARGHHVIVTVNESGTVYTASAVLP